MEESLENMITRHEGIELKIYTDSVGKLTIGVGRNIEDNGISYNEAMMLLRNDISRTRLELMKFSWWMYLSMNQRNALIDMCFNLGITRFKKFKKMIKALEEKDYKMAAKEMLDSKAAKQTGKRYKELAKLLEDK